MKDGPSVMSTVVAALFLALVAYVFWVATRAPFNKDNFQTIWTAVGPLVGVLTGAIPAYFFRAQAAAERQRNRELGDQSRRIAARVAPEMRQEVDQIVETSQGDD